MLAVPLMVVLALAVLHAQFADVAAVTGALRGMAAVSAGMIAATGLKLASSLRKHPLRWWISAVLAVFCVIFVVLLHLPLAYTLLSMSEAPLHLVLTLGDWLNLFAHYLLLSLMSIGGAISTTSEMHRFLVEEHHWLTQAQFNDAIAIAQAAPGPNVLFVALMGWKVGLNTGSYLAAFAGVAVTMLGILIPSTTLTYLAARWGHENRELLGVRAFKQGMAPVVVGLMGC
eukprot:gene12796-12588_t